MSEQVIAFCKTAAWILPSVMFLSAAGAAAFAVILLKVNAENIRRMEKIPRMRIPGIVLGFAVLLWCIPNIMPILPESLHKFLLPLMIAGIIAAWFALDHIFARAIAGFMILAAHYFLKALFPVHPPCFEIFAAICLLYGTAGIIIGGQPWLIRDAIRLGTAKFKFVCPVLLAVYAISAAAMAIYIIFNHNF